MLAVVAGVLLGGCDTTFQLDGNAAAPSADQSVVIPGLQGERSQVFIFPGRILPDGQFLTNPKRMATVAGKGKDGYLIGKARAGEAIAITTVRYDTKPDAISGTEDFRPCSGEKTMVFKVPQGKVACLGSVDYRVEAPTLHIRCSQELPQAQADIDAHFPATKGKVEHIAQDYMPVKGACTGTRYIPIYIAR